MACKCKAEHDAVFNKFWNDYLAEEKIPIPGGFVIGPDWGKLPAFLPTCSKLCPEAALKLDNPLYQEKRQAHLSRDAGSNLNLPPNVEDQRVPLSFTPLCDAPFGKIVRYYVDLDYFAPRILMEIARIMSVHDPLIVGDNQFVAIINERV